MDILGIVGMVSSMADAEANREAAKDNARRQELKREYTSQMKDQQTKRGVTDYNAAARKREIDRFAAQDSEQARSFQGEQAEAAIRPRATLGLEGIAKDMRDRDMMNVDEIAGTNPLTGGSAWADALTGQHRDLMVETGQDADDMSLLQAGARRDVGDEEVLGQVAATQQGESPRISSMQQDSSVAQSDVGARADKRSMDIGVKEQAIDTKYEPWIEGYQNVAKGSMGDAAELAKGIASSKTISDAFKPAAHRVYKPGGTDGSSVYGTGGTTYGVGSFVDAGGGRRSGGF
jgi:hypothetical protein